MLRAQVAKINLLLWIMVVLVSLWSTLEAGAEGLAPERTPERRGLFFGASFGRGSIDVECGDCSDMPRISEALSVAAHLGLMLTPRLAVLGEHWSVRYNSRGGAWFDDSAEHLVAQHISAMAAQVFVTDSLWFKAGAGVGWHITDGDYARERPRSTALARSVSNGTMPSSDESSSDLSPASFVAVGWEFAHNSAFAAEIQARAGVSGRNDAQYQVYNTAFNVGCSWY